jgi:antagonist of KipI
MSVSVLKAGIFSSVQDLGRTGYRRYGIGAGGSMDRAAMRLANALLSNRETAAVLEMHFPAAELRFNRDTAIVGAGADFAPQLDEQPIQNWRVIHVRAGATLKFTSKSHGHRCYIAVAGGIDGDLWLGSTSTNTLAGLGGISGRALSVGDEIRIGIPYGLPFPQGFISPSLIPRYSHAPTVRIIAGAELSRLNEKSRQAFFEGTFTVTPASDRMGYRLSGPPIASTDTTEMLSSAVAFGTIQLLPSGELVILMADHQTIGGYPRLGHVITRDLPLLAQLGPGDKLGFHPITVHEAEELAAEFERDLSYLKVACRFGR